MDEKARYRLAEISLQELRIEFFGGGYAGGHTPIRPSLFCGLLARWNSEVSRVPDEMLIGLGV